MPGSGANWTLFDRVDTLRRHATGVVDYPPLRPPVFLLHAAYELLDAYASAFRDFTQAIVRLLRARTVQRHHQLVFDGPAEQIRSQIETLSIQRVHTSRFHNTRATHAHSDRVAQNIMEGMRYMQRNMFHTCTTSCGSSPYACATA